MQLTLTFIVTEQCQLRCKYCYVINKSNKFMTFDVARRAVDIVLNDELFRTNENTKDSLNIDFIGGEPLLKIDLISNISRYVLQRSFELNHPWFGNIQASISTNGILYNDPKVQSFIKEFKNILGIGITIDGTKEMHDAARIYPSGKGSYNDIVSSIPLWLSQFPNSQAKITIAPENIEMLSDAVLHLFELGHPRVHANCVFEPVWKEEHADILYNQMVELAKGLKEKNISLNKVTLFDDFIGKPIDPQEDQNWCGAGKYMLTVGTNGDFYPCFRFANINVSKEPIRVGNIYTGIDHKLREPFCNLSRAKQSPPECLTCEVASGCAWCNGANQEHSGRYDKRLTAICIMHKARVRAKNYARQIIFKGEKNE